MDCQLRMPNLMHLYDHIRANAAHGLPVVHGASGAGKTVAICGAGPSLRQAKITARADEVWACNSALPYLMDRGDRVTHAVGIDQGTAMLDPKEWGRTFDVQYYVASSVHPSLVTHLLDAERDVTVFHSYLGIPDPEGWAPPKPGLAHEMYLYQTLYPESVQVGHGLNSVPRAICLALYLGFTKIIVYGADCACAPDGPPMPEYLTPAYAEWMTQIVMYADGRSAATHGQDAIMAEAEIDGTRWHTRPDMVISARHMVDLTRNYPGRITLVGRTLPTVFARQSSDWWDRLPALTGVGLVKNFANAIEVAA